MPDSSNGAPERILCCGPDSMVEVFVLWMICYQARFISSSSPRGDSRSSRPEIRGQCPLANLSCRQEAEGLCLLIHCEPAYWGDFCHLSSIALRSMKSSISLGTGTAAWGWELGNECIPSGGGLSLSLPSRDKAKSAAIMFVSWLGLLPPCVARDGVPLPSIHACSVVVLKVFCVDDLAAEGLITSRLARRIDRRKDFVG